MLRTLGAALGATATSKLLGAGFGSETSGLAVRDKGTGDGDMSQQSEEIDFRALLNDYTDALAYAAEARCTGSPEDNGALDPIEGLRAVAVHLNGHYR